MTYQYYYTGSQMRNFDDDILLCGKSIVTARKMNRQSQGVFLNKNLVHLDSFIGTSKSYLGKRKEIQKLYIQQVVKMSVSGKKYGVHNVSGG